MLTITQQHNNICFSLYFSNYEFCMVVNFSFASHFCMLFIKHCWLGNLLRVDEDYAYSIKLNCCNMFKMILMVIIMMSPGQQDDYWNVFSSNHGRKMGNVAGYWSGGVLCAPFVLPLLFLRANVPSSFRNGYVANIIGNWSLIDFSRLLGVTTNWNRKENGEIIYQITCNITSNKL